VKQFSKALGRKSKEQASPGRRSMGSWRMQSTVGE